MVLVRYISGGGGVRWGKKKQIWCCPQAPAAMRVHAAAVRDYIDDMEEIVLVS